MPQVRYGGKQGKALQLEGDASLLVIRTWSGRLLRAGPVSIVLEGLELVVDFPEAGVEVYRRPDAVRRSMDDIKRALRHVPDIRFAGRGLVDPQSGEPVVYTENLFIKFQDDRDREHCVAVLRDADLIIKQELPYATNTFFVAAPEGTGQQVFTIAEDLLQRQDVDYCHPELIQRLGRRAISP